MSRPIERAETAAGFALVEILVAFAISALLLGAIYEVLSTGLQSAGTAARFSNAVLLAQSSLDALAGVPVVPGETHARIGPYERETRVRPRPDLRPAAPQLALPYEIDVRVAWHDGVRRREISLSTLRLGAPGDSP